MDPATFRRDPYLRTSASHLATWSLVGFVLELRLGGPESAGTPEGIVVAVLLAGAVLASLTHERRVGKMAGPAGPVGTASFEGAGRMWSGLLAALTAASALLLLASRPQWLFDAWTVGVGSGFAVWGWKAGFAWYTGLGLALVAVGAVDAIVTAAGGSVLALRCLVLALALPAFSLVTNRRFLWFRPASGG